MRALVIAGTASGVGKTTVATGLIAALARRGLRVQPFKVGPDYIDPSYHAAAAGRPSRNLDSWMLPSDALAELYARAASACDVSIVEGVMGLYDGRSGAGEIGSTAHVAKLIGAPVILVVDAARTARSAAAVALGFRQLDPELGIAGVILNNVASDSHYRAVAEPIEREAGLAVLGSLPKNAAWRWPERYLGLIPAPERPLDAAITMQLADAVSAHVDLERLLRIATGARVHEPAPTGLFPTEPIPIRTRIALARDSAFNFYYEDNLDLLRAWGAEIVEFSPLADGQLPAGIGGVYIGGGFPELFGAQLAANRDLRADVRQAAARGLPIYAECGGLMYLADELTDRDGRNHQMVGLLSGRSTLERGRLTLGYREVRARRDSLLLTRGETVRGHEFHWSTLDDDPSREDAAYDVLGTEPRVEGFARPNQLASYVHLHFGADVRLAQRFVDACAAWSPRRTTALAPSTETVHPTCHPEPNSDVILSVSEGTYADPRHPAPPAVGPLLGRHGLPPDEIESLSLRRIEQRAGDRLPAHEPERSLVARLVYAVGDPTLADAVCLSSNLIEAAVAALRRGAPILVDVKMVAAGLNRAALTELGCQLTVAVEVDGAAAMASALGITRTAAGVLAAAGGLDGAVVAIGNAPTALLAVLDLAESSATRPAAVIGLPVGFVAATESKEALTGAGLPFLTVAGTRGGSALAAAALNHLLKLATSTPVPASDRLVPVGPTAR